MPHIEVFKIKQTVPSEVKGYGMIEFFGMVEGPLPSNYVRHWSGVLPSEDLDTVCGQFFLCKPDGYRGGPLSHSDVLAVDGVAYFVENGTTAGFNLALVSFDRSSIRDEIHVDYGRGI